MVWSPSLSHDRKWPRPLIRRKIILSFGANQATNDSKDVFWCHLHCSAVEAINSASRLLRKGVYLADVTFTYFTVKAHIPALAAWRTFVILVSFRLVSLPFLFSVWTSNRCTPKFYKSLETAKFRAFFIHPSLSWTGTSPKELTYFQNSEINAMIGRSCPEVWYRLVSPSPKFIGHLGPQNVRIQITGDSRGNNSRTKDRV